MDGIIVLFFVVIQATIKKLQSFMYRASISTVVVKMPKLNMPHIVHFLKYKMFNIFLDFSIA